MRVSQKTPAGLIWQDQVWRIPKPTPETVAINIDSKLLESVKRIPRRDFEFEIDLQMMPMRIGERGKRPVAAYALLTVDRDSSFMLGMELMEATDSITAMYSRVPNKLLGQLDEHAMVPQRLNLRSEKLRAVIEPLAQMLNIEVRYVKNLPIVNRALKEFKQMLQGGH